jgi:DNA-binding response OmpR family regulator
MPKSILVVEDEPDAGQAIHDMLSFAGFTVSVAETAKEAVTKAHDQPPDLMLIDIGLPDGNGLFLAHMLSQVHEVPVVIMTGRPSFSLEEPLGANPRVKAVLFKPCSSRTLLSTVQDAVR